jgi:uracil-DNA glycosylase
MSHHSAGTKKTTSINLMQELSSKGWLSILQPVMEMDEYKKLKSFLAQKYKSAKVNPDYDNIFRSLLSIHFNDVKVVIVGQDPYHGQNQANGFAFSINSGLALPPTLRNVFHEMSSDLNIVAPRGQTTLFGWVDQGVLLLNSVLTVEEGKPGSHRGIGWETVTDAIISGLSARQDPVVFLLWGSYAKLKLPLVNRKIHAVLEASHPSPLSVAGFYKTNHFSKTNALLTKFGKSSIDWSKIDRKEETHEQLRIELANSVVIGTPPKAKRNGEEF